MFDHRARRWLIVAAYVGTIFATIPFAPRLWFGLSHVTGLELEPLALSILIAAGVGLSIPVLMRPRAATILAVAIVVTLYVAANRLPFQAPAERLHFLEYGLLPVLIAWAQDRRRSVGHRLLIGAIASTGIGVVDELIQAVAPSRVMEFADIVLNASSASLGAVACWILVRSDTRG